MMEINWGSPVKLLVSQDGTPEVKTFTTLEMVQHWLTRKWPVDDAPRAQAITRVEAAMDCLLPVSAARKAFFAAAESAGFRLI